LPNLEATRAHSGGSKIHPFCHRFLCRGASRSAGRGSDLGVIESEAALGKRLITMSGSDVSGPLSGLFNTLWSAFATRQPPRDDCGGDPLGAVEEALHSSLRGRHDDTKERLSRLELSQQKSASPSFTP
jgi:hypothetical protein